MSANLEIQNAFLEGIEEAFSIMFTQETELRFLSDETEVNIYDEAGFITKETYDITEPYMAQNFHPFCKYKESHVRHSHNVILLSPNPRLPRMQ